MIIFNLYAILVAFICVVVVLPIAGILSLIPGVSENEALLGIIAIGLSTVVSGICETVGIKGRIFFIPMWFIGIVLTIVTVCTQYGWAGFGVLVLCLIGLMVLIYFVASYMENKEWEDAPGELVECQRIADVSRKDFWEHFQKALFIPTMKAQTPENCYHNYHCLELIKNLGVDWAPIDPLMNACSAITHGEEGAEIKEEMTNEIAELITERLKELDE